MKITKVAAITGGITLGALAGAAFQFNAVSPYLGGGAVFVGPKGSIGALP